jgi:Acyclic terpene utilisation family protein AtuA
MTALRIANCSGFYGDRASAAREMIEGGDIDVLTGDYLAELTMMILWKAYRPDGSGGYARTFVSQMEDVLGIALERGIKVVTNAGGLNPAGLAAAVQEVGRGLGLSPKVSYITGDDMLARLGELQEGGVDLRHIDRNQTFADLDRKAVTANVYLGSWGIVEALEHGADIVVAPRVTDAALTVGPAAWKHGWARTDWDPIAAAVLAGHVIECGTQATGGNFAFFREVPNLRRLGFPIAEVAADGTIHITKHDIHNGLVSLGTVTAQLLYEVASPRYITPDVVARLDTAVVEQVDRDRVRITGVRGEPPTGTSKLGINYIAGFRNSMSFVLTGLDIEAKADLLLDQLFDLIGAREEYDAVEVELIRSDQMDAPTNETALAYLGVTVRSRDGDAVGRRFSGACVELGLASYPGFTTTTPPTDGESYAAMWPTLVPSELVSQIVVHHDGSTSEIPELVKGPPGDPVRIVSVDAEVQGSETTWAPLGRLFGARSGDKGGNANCGMWATSDAAYVWLRDYLSIDRLQSYVGKQYDVRRFEFPNLRALNFVIYDYLGEGVAANAKRDPQAKGLGEYVRSRYAPIPSALLRA